jgi:hypothetical protein
LKIISAVCVIAAIFEIMAVTIMLGRGKRGSEMGRT